MSKEITLDVDFTQPPVILKDLDEDDNCFTRGDSHANLIAMVHFAACIGCISITDNIYYYIYSLYNKQERYSASELDQLNIGEKRKFLQHCPKYTANDFALFTQLFLKLKVNPGRFARYLGDNFADRLYSDYLGLLFFGAVKIIALRKGLECPYELISGNHDKYLDRWIEDGMPTLHAMINDPTLKSRYSCLWDDDDGDGRSQRNSLINLAAAVELGFVEKDTVQWLYNFAYRPELRIFACDITATPWAPADKTMKALVYTHAVTDKIHLDQACRVFGEAPPTYDREDIAKKIDGVNSAFLQLSRISYGFYRPVFTAEEKKAFPKQTTDRRFYYSCCNSRKLPSGASESQVRGLLFANGHNAGRLSHGAMVSSQQALTAAPTQTDSGEHPRYANRSDIDGDLGKNPSITRGKMTIIITNRRKPQLQRNLVIDYSATAANPEGELNCLNAVSAVIEFIKKQYCHEDKVIFLPPIMRSAEKFQQTPRRDNFDAFMIQLKQAKSSYTSMLPPKPAFQAFHVDAISYFESCLNEAGKRYCNALPSRADHEMTLPIVSRKPRY